MARPRRNLLAMSLIAYSATSGADERILDYQSEILIRADGSMNVTETIQVRAEGAAILRGIFRDFPTDYRDRFGNRYRVAFDVTSVLRDGTSEPYFTEALSNGTRVYVGDANVLLAPGEYEYRLGYRTDFQIGFFADHDELYWNVTGNGWDFPIDNARARVTLPANAGVNALAMQGYTGPIGSQEAAIRASIESGATATIASTRPLRAREGLTLVMSWPKGIVAEPTALERMVRLLADNLGLLIALGSLITIAAYLFTIWRAYGRDPRAGPIFPHYEPPERISPASARHISRMGYDQTTFTAAIINLAVKGYLEIDEADGQYTLRPVGGGKAELSSAERALFKRLFAGDSEVELDGKKQASLLRAMLAHGKALQRENYTVYFVTNWIYLVPAIAILIGAFVAILMLDLFSLAVIATLLLTILLVPLFAYLLKAPTGIGRRLLDKIEGFKLYLDVAEKDELELRNPPEKTPELFEAYLPYALALGVEQSWAEKFDAVFERIRAETGESYSPGWYRGHWDSRDVSSGSMAAKMTGALGSAIAAAASPPGSSSGGGSGGSSGGGGGGGGGGGW